jgi:hypothetical protein
MSKTKFNILIEDQSLDDELKKVIVDRLKVIIRQDDKLQEIVDGYVEREIDKKINMSFILFDHNYIKQQIKMMLNNMEISKIAEKVVLSEIKQTDFYKNLLLEQNNKTIQSLFKHEIKDYQVKNYKIDSDEKN